MTRNLVVDVKHIVAVADLKEEKNSQMMVVKNFKVRHRLKPKCKYLNLKHNTKLKTF